VRTRCLPLIGALALFAEPTVAAEQASKSAAKKTDSSEEPIIPLSPRSVKLFDLRRSVSAYTVDLGPIWARKTEDRAPGEKRENAERGPGELSVGQSITTTWGPFFLAGHQKTTFRIVDWKSYSWSIWVQELATGVKLGPFEPEVRIGAAFLTVDVFHAEWSFQLLSPRVAAGAAVRLGKIRVDIKAHSEYLWRWFGSDYLIHGVTLGFGLDIPRPKSPLEGP
jgi:hypothetical protein